MCCSYFVKFGRREIGEIVRYLPDYLLSTHADRQGVHISFTVCNCVCFLFVQLGISEDKASGVKFCMVVHRRPGQEMSHLGNLAPPEAQNRTNRPPTRK